MKNSADQVLKGVSPQIEQNAMQDLTHKSSKRNVQIKDQRRTAQQICSMRGRRKYQRRLHTNGKSLHRNCRKSPRSNKEGNQAMAKGGNLESNRRTTDDP